MPTGIDPQVASETLSQSAESLRMAVEATAGDGESVDWCKIETALSAPDASLDTLRRALSTGQAALNQLFLS